MRLQIFNQSFYWNHSKTIEGTAKPPYGAKSVLLPTDSKSSQIADLQLKNLKTAETSLLSKSRTALQHYARQHPYLMLAMISNLMGRFTFVHAQPPYATFNLSTLDGVNGFTINGVFENDQTGWSLGSGDINGDGIIDMLIGANAAPWYANLGPGQSYVVFGSEIPFPLNFNLSNLPINKLLAI